MTRVTRDTVVSEAKRIATEVAAKHADEVDRDARFPREAFDAMKEVGLLSAWIPTEFGGAGASINEIGAATEELGKVCASTAMVFAMHQIQVACLVYHGDSDFLRGLTKRVADEQLLLGSATTEIGIGGDVRRSTCAVEDKGDGTFVLVKNAPVISYGNEADVILVTARKNADAAPSDQVLVFCEKADLDLEQKSEWNTLGFRGTCSPGFIINAKATVDHILPHEYADISARTMLPVAHTLWASAWLGIAEGAASTARKFLRQAARRNPGQTPPGALRLAELDVVLASFRDRVHSAARRYDEVDPNSDAATSMGRAIDFNTLKVFASATMVDVVSRALLITGIQGYRLDGELSLARPLRDAYGAQLMVNNDRILTNTAGLELVHRGE